MLTPLHGKETEAGRTCCLRKRRIYQLKRQEGVFFLLFLKYFYKKTFYGRQEIVAESLILKYFKFWDRTIVWRFEQEWLHRLLYLSAWCWGVALLGGVSLLRKCVTGVGFGVSKCLSLLLRPADLDGELSATSRHHVCLHAAMLPTMPIVG